MTGPTGHSKIGASSASRWMSCPGSVRLSEGMPNESSFFAKEGTAAHALAEVCLSNGYLADRFFGGAYMVENQKVLDEKELARTETNDELISIDEEMVEGVQLYIDTVRKDYRPGDVLAIEQRFHLETWHPALFGTNDASIYRPATGELKVYDLKYGRGVPVNVVDNPQLKYYGLGALMAERGRHLSTVELVIVQPRCPHPDGPVRRWEIDPFDLLEWASDLVAAAERTETSDELNPGEWCKFCPAAAICPALRQKVLDSAKADFTDSGALLLPDPTKYKPADLAKALEDVKLIEDWCRRVLEFAHHEAEAGRTPPGWKLVPKRPSRKWSSEHDAREALKLMYEVEDEHLYTEPKMRSPAQMEAALKAHYGLKGKAAKEAISDYVKSESSGAVLAPESDPREPVKPEAARDFTVET